MNPIYATKGKRQKRIIALKEKKLPLYPVLTECVDHTAMVGRSLAKHVSSDTHMQTLTMHEAKTKLSSLVEKALKGEEVIIGKAGKPLVRLVPFHPAKKPRKPGRL